MTTQIKTPAARFFGCIVQPLLLVAMLLSAGQAAATAVSSLSPGDVVRITVYGNSDLTTVARIAANGSITFPLIGDLNIGGLTTAESERTISRLLDQRGFVKSAQVSIFVEERSEISGLSVTILGQVKTSGRFPLRDGTIEGVQTLIDLLAIAGGVNDNAADYLYLVRQQGENSQNTRVDLVELLRSGDIDENVNLADGDIVLVPGMDVFYIYGEVTRPGRYRLERGMTVMQALSVASGTTRVGNEKGIVLNRKGVGGLKESEADLDDELQPDDVIYVKQRFF